MRPRPLKGRIESSRHRVCHGTKSVLTRFTLASAACVLLPFRSRAIYESGSQVRSPDTFDNLNSSVDQGEFQVILSSPPLGDFLFYSSRWRPDYRRLSFCLMVRLDCRPHPEAITLFKWKHVSLLARLDCRTNPTASTLGFSGAWRIGEASNPGPKDVLIVTSANVTSIPKRIDDLNSFTKDTHVCLVQEAGLTSSNVNLVRSDLKDKGWRRVLSGPLSTPQSRRALHGQRSYREKGNHASGGVAVLSRGVVVTPWELPPEPQRDEAFDILIQSQRWLPVVVSVEG